MKTIAVIFLLTILITVMTGCYNENSSYPHITNDAELSYYCGNEYEQQQPYDTSPSVTPPNGELIQLFEENVENTSAREAFLAVLNGNVGFHATNFERENPVWFIDEFIAIVYEHRFAFIELENEEIPIILFLDSETSGASLGLLLHYYDGTIYGTFNSRLVLRDMDARGHFWHNTGPSNSGVLYKTATYRNQLIFTELSRWQRLPQFNYFSIDNRAVSEEELMEFFNQEDDAFEAPIWRGFER